MNTKISIIIFVVCAIVAWCVVYIAWNKQEKIEQEKSLKVLTTSALPNDIQTIKERIQIDSKLNDFEAYQQAVAMYCASVKYGIEWKTIYALARTEVENFDYTFHRVYTNGTHDGYGNLQVVISTARYFDKNITPELLIIPSKNYDIGVAYFKSLLDIYYYDLKKSVQSYKRGYDEKKFEEIHWKHFQKYRKELD